MADERKSTTPSHPFTSLLPKAQEARGLHETRQALDRLFSFVVGQLKQLATPQFQHELQLTKNGDLRDVLAAIQEMTGGGLQRHVIQNRIQDDNDQTIFLPNPLGAMAARMQTSSSQADVLTARLTFGLRDRMEPGMMLLALASVVEYLRRHRDLDTLYAESRTELARMQAATPTGSRPRGKAKNNRRSSRGGKRRRGRRGDRRVRSGLRDQGNGTDHQDHQAGLISWRGKGRPASPEADLDVQSNRDRDGSRRLEATTARQRRHRSPPLSVWVDDDCNDRTSATPSSKTAKAVATAVPSSRVRSVRTSSSASLSEHSIAQVPPRTPFGPSTSQQRVQYKRLRHGAEKTARSGTRGPPQQQSTSDVYRAPRKNKEAAASKAVGRPRSTSRKLVNEQVVIVKPKRPAYAASGVVVARAVHPGQNADVTVDPAVVQKRARAAIVVRSEASDISSKSQLEETDAAGDDSIQPVSSASDGPRSPFNDAGDMTPSLQLCSSVSGADDQSVGDWLRDEPQDLDEAADSTHGSEPVSHFDMLKATPAMQGADPTPSADVHDLSASDTIGAQVPALLYAPAVERPRRAKSWLGRHGNGSKDHMVSTTEIAVADTDGDARDDDVNEEQNSGVANAAYSMDYGRMPQADTPSVSSQQDALTKGHEVLSEDIDDGTIYMASSPVSSDVANHAVHIDDSEMHAEDSDGGASPDIGAAKSEGHRASNAFAHETHDDDDVVIFLFEKPRLAVSE
eukprot:TRINITY_DN12204_c0_g1_i14.p1 TRINITY_DN12204_c0_g1~~TRINITY_DN12204_c0_g1_i14.p1  ORF type:complete len:740 (-),score=120.33 TRINITY_DN12204_c0_g1_i14:72-2291(-)